MGRKPLPIGGSLLHHCCAMGKMSLCVTRENPQVIRILLPSERKVKDGSKICKGNEKQGLFFFLIV